MPFPRSARTAPRRSRRRSSPGAPLRSGLQMPAVPVRRRGQACRLSMPHGLFCVGCCWSFMLVMFIVGVGDLGWILVLGAVMALEKNLPWGRQLSVPLGALLLAWGITLGIQAVYASLSCHVCADGVARSASAGPTASSVRSSLAPASGSSSGSAFKEAIMRWLRTIWLITMVRSSGFAWPAWAEDAPPLRHLQVNGVDLSYLDQGTGAPVVFVHGSFLDLRFWEPQRQAIAQQNHFIAYNRRYHGPAAWPDNGKDYSVATHAADLAAFPRQLQAGPVHLVGHSYGGLLATLVAIEYPELLRSVTLAEPGMGALLADMPEGKSVLDDRSRAMAPAREAVKAGDAAQATKLLFDWVACQGAGAFEKPTGGGPPDDPGQREDGATAAGRAGAASGLLRHPERGEGPHPGHRRGADAALFFADQ